MEELQHLLDSDQNLYVDMKSSYHVEYLRKDETWWIRHDDDPEDYHWRHAIGQNQFNTSMAWTAMHLKYFRVATEDDLIRVMTELLTQ